MRKSVIITILLLLLVLLAVGATLWINRGTKGVTTHAEAEVLKIGYLPIASDASFFVALEKEFFAREGLKVNAVKFETSNQVLEALIAGRIDATSIVALESILALEANSPGQVMVFEMAAATGETRVHEIVVRKSSAIQKLEQLRGK
ncbi:MAG TPA: ABC transporter substrate-binding protein, partial [Thermoanaerobaculia bacterium]